MSDRTNFAASPTMAAALAWAFACDCTEHSTCARCQRRIADAEERRKYGSERSPS